MSKEQIAQLESIGMVWIVGDLKNDEWYESLKQYYEEHGDLLVPVDYKTSDGKKIGRKVHNLRTAYKNNKLTPEQIEQLELIGMVWVVGKTKEKQLTFDEWYIQLKQYYEEHGDLLIPGSYINSQGNRLGYRINTLRKAYKNNILT